MSDAAERGLPGLRRRVVRWLRQRRPEHRSASTRRVFVYTVITGSYDEPPTFRDLDESVECFCFTDAARQVSEPWQVQPIPAYFGDPKLTSGFLKTHPHLLFPDDSIVVWVDGNLDELALSVKGVGQMLGDGAVAVPVHRERDRVRDEAEIVARLRLDDPIRVARLLHSLETSGFPDDIGLSATMFLVRDLAHPAMRQMNETWWEGVAELSRRDQLSFEFALWRSGLRRRVIDVDYREPNDVFVRRPHAAPRRRVLDEDAGRLQAQVTAWLSADPAPSERATPVWHRERWTPATAELLRRLNAARVRSCAARSGDGYGHGSATGVGERTPPDIRRSWQREFLRRSAATSRHALLLGCDGGYTAALLLDSNPAVEVRVIDEEHRRGPCAGLLEVGRAHPERVDVTDVPTGCDAGWGRLRGFDLVHIDATAVPGVTADLDGSLAGLEQHALVVIRGELPVEVVRSTERLEPLTPGFPSDGFVRLFRWTDPDQP